MADIHKPTTVKLSERAIRRIQHELLTFNNVVMQPKTVVNVDKKNILAKGFGSKKAATATTNVPNTDPVVEENKASDSGASVPTKKEEIKTIFLRVVDDSNMGHLRGMVIGPADTPYEGAIFYFDINIPSDYPIAVPKFKFITPNESTCRMHPNLYAEGKCCLSILNTWASNQWCATSTLENILITIQGILIDNPIVCEPGHEHDTLGSERSIHYNITARHRALSAGFVDFMKRQDVPAEMMEGIKKYVRVNIGVYRHAIKMLNHDLELVGLFKDGKKTKLESVAIQHLHSSGFILTRKRVRELITKIEATIADIVG